MPYRMYHTIYRSAWMESVAKAKEAEEEEKRLKEEEKKANSGGGTNRPLSQGERLDKLRASSFRGIDLDDLEDELT